jgi:hypothetical protein
MFKLIKRSTDYVKLAKSLGKIAKILKKHDSLEQYMVNDKYVLICAYIVKVRVIPIMEEQWYPYYTLIAIEELSDSRITLGEAFDLTVNRLEDLAKLNNVKLKYDEVMAGGKLFYEIQNEIPESKINSI